jgi:hypothetical protein
MPLDVLGRTVCTELSFYLMTRYADLLTIARYTDRASEYSLGRKARVILLNSVVLGIGHCNYCPSTRNS